MLLVELDGMPEAVATEAKRVKSTCARLGSGVTGAHTEDARNRLWQDRRDLSLALRALAPRKINHDVVVPKGRIPQLFALIARLREVHQLPMPSFGHVGDGNLHYNVSQPADMEEAAFRSAGSGITDLIYELVTEMGGSISAEHGIGVLKKESLERFKDPVELALMRRVKNALDPANTLNPGKVV